MTANSSCTSYEQATTKTGEGYPKTRDTLHYSGGNPHPLSCEAWQSAKKLVTQKFNGSPAKLSGVNKKSHS